MRMHMRRFTRLTNGFSKKVEAPANAVALHFMYYNFVRIQKTLRVTPAIAAGVTDKLWKIGDIVALIEAKEAERPVARGHYKKRICRLADIPQWNGIFSGELRNKRSIPPAAEKIAGSSSLTLNSCDGLFSCQCRELPSGRWLLPCLP